ncbi:unnamed protein product [Nippostrongylus brasiliensis]|uniref:DDE-1 domain-containing protein n=1 Tax=Nippostrongylus brasiliensis TaxID=27835 RepID=A0A0N4XFS0_NIPBR|nr:unnamed protein product [Nippostrongylus brasiliensis]
MSVFEPDFTPPTKRKMAIGDAFKRLLQEAVYSDIYCEDEDEDEEVQVRFDEEMEVDWSPDDDYDEEASSSSSETTLAPVGARSITRVVQSTDSLPHSFTAMPVIYADGKLGEKLLSGHWQSLNLLVMAGWTHIMTKSPVPSFTKECVAASSGPPLTILLADSWAGFRDHRNVVSQVPHGKEVRLMTIPAGATIYFFRLFERYIRRLHNRVIQHHPEFNVSSRSVSRVNVPSV